MTERTPMQLPFDWQFPDAPADYDGYEILTEDKVTEEEPDDGT